MVGFHPGASGGSAATPAALQTVDDELAVIDAVVGDLDDAAAVGDPSTIDTLVAKLNQIINILMGTDGIAAFPAAAAAANGVSLAEVIRQIAEGVGGRLVFPSDGVQAEVVVNAAAGNVSLPSVVVTLPSGINVNKINLGVQWRKQVDSSGAVNAVNVAQKIQVRSDAPGTWTDAITIPDGSLSTGAGATEGGSALMGSADIKGEVDESDTYEIRWEAADVDGASLTFHDWQCFVIVEYT